MGKRLWDLAKSRIEIGTILPGHRTVTRCASQGAQEHPGDGRQPPLKGRKDGPPDAFQILAARLVCRLVWSLV